MNRSLASGTLWTALVVAAASAAPADAVAQETGCVTAASADDLAGRPSPLDSVSFQIDGHTLQVCYSRPSARGRTMIGGSAVPFGRLWRTGANEPTIVNTPAAVSIAGVGVPAGTYSLYTVPGEGEWEIIVNRSYSQWGHEGRYTAEVQAQEVGRGRVPTERVDEPIETFTIRWEAGNLILEWETWRVRVPIQAGD